MDANLLEALSDSLGVKSMGDLLGETAGAEAAGRSLLRFCYVGTRNSTLRTRQSVRRDTWSGAVVGSP